MGNISTAKFLELYERKLFRATGEVLNFSWLGLIAHFVPEVFSNMPKLVQDIGHSSIAVGGLSAIFATLILSFGKVEDEEAERKERPIEVRKTVEAAE